MGMRAQVVISIIVSILVLSVLGINQNTFAVSTPDKITDLSLTVISDTQVKLNWTIPDDGGSLITGYKIIQYVFGQGATVLETNFGDDTTNSYSDNTLENGDRVFYRIAAKNDNGQGQFSNLPRPVTTTSSLDVPDKITDLSLTVISDTQVKLNWTIPDDGGSLITGYRIDRLLNGVLSTIETSYNPNAVFYLDKSLSPGDQVQYRIAAINMVGTALYGNIPAPVITDSEPISELPLMIFSPTEVIEEVVNDRLNSNDYVVSFLVPLLLEYPEFNQNLVSYSIPTTMTAIDNANQNDFEIVSYDNEIDNDDLSTPPDELIDPAKSTNEAVKLINDAGLISAVVPTNKILLKEYRGVDWSQVDILILQLQTNTTQEITSITNFMSRFVKSQGDTQVFLQVNPQFVDVSIIGDRVELVRDRIDGVSILCFHDDGCDAVVFSDLLSELGR